MEQIDWDKAPEGATHFLPEQVARGWVACWYKFVDGTWFARNVRDCDWYPDHDYQEIFIPLLIGKPAPWSGTGLPPVGTVCEYSTLQPTTHIDQWLLWSRVEIVCHHQQGDHIYAVFASMSGYHGNRRPECFRPIRTAEQIAAEQREKDIIEIARTIMPGLVAAGADDIARAEKLYKAGYRKFEIVPE